MQRDNGGGEANKESEPRRSAWGQQPGRRGIQPSERNPSTFMTKTVIFDFKDVCYQVTLRASMIICHLSRTEKSKVWLVRLYTTVSADLPLWGADMYMQLLIMYAAAQRTVEKISLLEEDTTSFNSARTQDKFLQQVVAPVMCKFSRSLFWTW